MANRGVAAEEAEAAAAEPVDGPDHFVPAVTGEAEIKEPGDIAPGMRIPSSGRGNSDDGLAWENPSSNQLFRALHRKNKPIEEEDSSSVAHVHAEVTDGTWNAIMDYENMHPECPNPKLARFYGMYGIPTLKSRFTKMWSNLEPFDRHDWIVDRCGKEVPRVPFPCRVVGRCGRVLFR